MHWHPGLNHSHPHEHSEERNHHGPPFGIKTTIFLGDQKEPDLSFLLAKSFEKVEAERERD